MTLVSPLTSHTDHILTLQQSLAHYERMLSHSHPAYLSHLRVSLSQAKGGMDKALLMLSGISVSVVVRSFSNSLG
jgi:magnesium transporter